MKQLDIIMSQNQRLKLCVDEDQLQVKMGQGHNQELFNLKQANNDLQTREIDVVNADRKNYKSKLTEVTRQIDELNEQALRVAELIEQECKDVESMTVRNQEVEENCKNVSY